MDLTVGHYYRMPTPTPQERVSQWLLKTHTTQKSLYESIGDPGNQLIQWLCGARPSLPMRLRVALVHQTGIEVRHLLSKDEINLALDIASLVYEDE